MGDSGQRPLRSPVRTGLQGTAHLQGARGTRRPPALPRPGFCAASFPVTAAGSRVWRQSWRPIRGNHRCHCQERQRSWETIEPHLDALTQVRRGRAGVGGSARPQGQKGRPVLAALALQQKHPRAGQA